jgi:hypothetical protein
VLEPGAVAVAATLAYTERRHAPSFSLALAGTGLLATALAAWVALAAPTNARFDRWAQDDIPADWRRSRDQWEFAHAARAILQVAGLGALTYAALSDASAPGISERVTELLRLHR